MNRESVSIAINFAVLLLLQVFVFNAIYLGVYINMMIYLVFILFLPTNLSRLSVLLLSALMGFSVDLLSAGDLGLHMAACTIIGFLRPVLLKKVSNNEIQADIPKIKGNFVQYAAYTGILIVLHHLFLFLLEAFAIRDILFTLSRTAASSVVNFCMIYFVRLLKRT